MDRREFVKFLGCLAAGTSALPAQVEAFTKYYDTNMPHGAGPFVAIDEVFLSGMATRSAPVYFSMYDENRLVLPVGINLFGGSVLWRAAADQKIGVRANDLNWRIKHSNPLDFKNEFIGQISYIDSNGVRCRRQIDALQGRL
jgi:hypothetical protein